MIRHEVPAGVNAQELSRYLRRAWPLLPGHALRDLLKNKDVRVNGARSGKGAQVRGGDVLEIYGDARWFEPSVEILFDDGHLLAAIKPQGLPSLPDRDGVGVMHPTARYLIEIPYPMLSRVDYFLNSEPVQVEDKSFGAAVTYTLVVRTADEEGFIARLIDLSEGKLEPLRAEEVYLAWPEEDA